MRWLCVHPSLPLQAELRIRAAPDSSAPEQCRIPHGRALATCSPLLQVRGKDDDATSTSWLQVAYLDAASGKMEEGFVMAAMPDGMSLVIPWEKTSHRGCCKVVDPFTLMFDGPQDAAQSLGVVQSVSFLYCMMEESERRVRIFHPDLESVWVDKKDLQVICTRLKHEECSTSHAFYEMNDELPEEAQIAVREFPSQEAQVVGLLSRGETLEVTMCSGNWLQIVGGSLDKAWIMFRTDVLELLHEARDVCSSSCQRIQGNVGDLVESEGTANQSFRANTHTVSLPLIQVASNKLAFTQVLEDDHEHDAAGEIGNEHAPFTVDVFSSMTVNVDTAENSQAWEKFSHRPAQQVALHDDNVSDTAALRTGVADDVADISVAVDTTTEVVKPAHAVQASDGRSVYSASFTQDEADENAGGDLAGAGVGIHSNDTNMEIKQMGYSRCKRPIQPARASLNEFGDDNSTAEDMATCKKHDTKKIDNGDPARSVSPQCDDSTRFLCDAPDPNDAVTEAIIKTLPQKPKMIVSGSNGMEAVVADLSWDHRPVRPARKVVAPNKCSAGTSDFAVSETRGAVVEHGPLSWNDPLRIEAKLMKDEIGDNGDNGDATAVGLANKLVYNIAAEVTKPVQNIESWDNRPIRSAPLHCDEAQVGNNEMVPVHGVVNVDTVVSFVDTCVDRSFFETWGDQPEKPSRAHPNRVSANGSTIADFDDGGPATRPNVKASAEEDSGPVHVKKPGNDRVVRPVQTVFDQTGDNEADVSSAIVAELAVVDTVNNSKARVNICAAHFETEPATPTQSTQSWGNRPIGFSSTISNEAYDGSFYPGCDSSRFRTTQVVHDEVNCNHDTGAIGFEARTFKVNVDEPSQSWEQRPILPQQTMPDALADSDFTRNRIGTAVADAIIAGKPSKSNDAKESMQVGNDRPSNLIMNDWVTVGGANRAAVSSNVVKAVNNVGDGIIADETHFMNVGPIVMDEIDKVTRVQTATIQDYPSALGNSAIVFSDADFEAVQDRHYSQPMACLTFFERRYAESETTSGSENGEIALLGGLEDVFEPVDEWLSATQEEDNEGFRNDNFGSIGALPASRDIVMNGEQGEHLDSSRIFSACYSAEETTQNGVAVQPAGISFLQVFGIRKYCEHKQNLIAPADELSVAVYEANEDDSDLVFQALVGDHPLSDDWFYDVSLRHSQAYIHTFSNDVDLLSARPRLTFDLIMSDASPEDILAAEVLDDDYGDFDLVISFEYPAPRRRVVGPSRAPPPFGCVPSAPAGIETEIIRVRNKSGIEAMGAPCASRQPSLPSHSTSTKTSHGVRANIDVTSSKTALSEQCMGQPKMPLPTSVLRRNSIMTPLTISKPPTSFARPRSLMQPLHGAPPVRYTNSAAPPLEASASSICSKAISSLLPSARSFLQRQSFVSTPSASRVALSSNSITDSTKHSEISAPRKSFGFRHPSGLPKKT